MSLLKRLGNAPPPESATPAMPESPTEEPRLSPPSQVSAPPPSPVSPTPSAPRGLSAMDEQPAAPRGLGAMSEQPVRPAVAIADGDSVSEQRLLELSLWIVDRIQGSLGNQADLKRSPETERMLQERFTNYYRQSGVN